MKKIITMLFVCMSSLGYGAEFQDTDVYDFDTNFPLSALIGENQLSDGAVLAVPVSMRVFEDLGSDEIDPGNFYFCGIQGCFECFSTIQDRTEHEMRVHGQGYSQAPGFQVFQEDGNGDMMISPEDGLGFQQSVDVVLEVPVSTSMVTSVAEQADTGPSGFSCKKCDKMFGFKSNLTRHMKTHTGERPYVCSYEGCGKGFAQKGNLDTHMRAHTVERPYVCSYERCGKEFAQKGNLDAHMRTHTGEKPYACSYEGCASRFALSKHLKDHIRTHTGERPYACPHQGCASRFTLSHHLKNHMRTHTGEKPFGCKECGKSFSRNSTLKVHMRRVHEQADKATSTFLNFEQAPDNNLEED
jgi:hypothetical protein